jgi:hypothetical protein
MEHGVGRKERVKMGMGIGFFSMGFFLYLFSSHGYISHLKAFKFLKIPRCWWLTSSLRG